jgi:RimJ/RimL family protein N-acetyltransferase
MRPRLHAAPRFGFEGLALPEIVSFTVPEIRRSRAAMERLGMTRDPADDLLRPALPEGHPSGPLVLNRVRRSE